DSPISGQSETARSGACSRPPTPFSSHKLWENDWSATNGTSTAERGGHRVRCPRVRGTGGIYQRSDSVGWVRAGDRADRHRGLRDTESEVASATARSRRPARSAAQPVWTPLMPLMEPWRSLMRACLVFVCLTPRVI